MYVYPYFDLSLSTKYILNITIDLFSLQNTGETIFQYTIPIHSHRDDVSSTALVPMQYYEIFTKRQHFLNKILNAP